VEATAFVPDALAAGTGAVVAVGCAKVTCLGGPGGSWTSLGGAVGAVPVSGATVALYGCAGGPLCRGGLLVLLPLSRLLLLLLLLLLLALLLLVLPVCASRRSDPAVRCAGWLACTLCCAGVPACTLCSPGQLCAGASPGTLCSCALRDTGPGGPMRTADGVVGARRYVWICERESLRAWRMVGSSFALTRRVLTALVRVLKAPVSRADALAPGIMRAAGNQDTVSVTRMARVSVAKHVKQR
jgi:hypothetical protein